MSGYFNFSMSNNARAAYADGEKPRSAWTKCAILSELDAETAARLSQLTAGELRARVLSPRGWHHTSSRYNRTDFFAVDTEKADEITAEDVARIVERRKASRAERAEEKATQAERPKDRRARVRYTVWSGTRKHPKAREVVEIVTIPTGGGMVQTENGQKRQSSLTVLEWLD